MSQTFFVDIDAICGKDLLKDKSKVRVVEPVRRLFSKLHENGVAIVLCGWNGSSITQCKTLKNELGADDIALSPSYNEDNSSFIPLFEKFHTTAKESFYAASNPTTEKKAKASNIAATRIHVSTPVALTKPELLSENDVTSREQFQILKKETYAFFAL